MKFYIPKLKHKYIKSQHFQSFKKGGLIPIFQNPSSALPIIEIPKEQIASDWFPQNQLSKAEQAIIDNELNKPVWIPREVNPNTDRNLNDMISKGVNKSLKQEAIQTLRSKTPAELKKIQKELADKGYYDEYIKDVKKLQLRLIELGYLSDTKREDGSYVEVDGIAGKKTKAAFRKSQIDGILGSKTINAYLKSQTNTTTVPNFEVDYLCNAKGCANYVTQVVQKYTPYSMDDGFKGHAWTMFNELQNRGGNIYYNLYNPDVTKYRSDKDQFNSALSKASANNPVPISEMQVGDIVGLHWGGSSYLPTAMKDGKLTYNNHVGIVSKIVDGIPYITHSTTYTNSRTEPYNKTGYVITALGRANNQQVYPELKVSDIPSFKLSEENKDAEDFIRGMDSADSLIKNIFGNVDTDLLKRAAIGIQKRETNLFKNRKSQQTGLQALKNKTGEFVKFVKGTPASAISTDFAKVKPGSFSTQEKKMLGISSADSLNDPIIAGRAVLYLLVRNYTYLKQLQKEIPEFTDEDLLNATILSYNQGLNKLKHLGFDPETKQFNFEEIQNLRRLATDDEVKDVTSTNWKHVPVLGEWIYDTWGDGHKSYIKSARDYMLTIPQTNIQSRRLGGTVYIKEKNKSACKYYTGGSVNLPEVVITPKSKGERYGNPLNIERRKKENGEYVKWEGSVEHNPDPRYEQFNTVYDGFRAGFKTLNTYNKKGFNTVSSIINRWAPNHENPTNNYIKFVSDKLDVDPNQKLDFNEETLISLAQAMSKFETGVDFDRNIIQKGYQLYKTK